MTTERRKQTQSITPQDAIRQQLRDLRSQERTIEQQLQGNKPVVNGQIDYSHYDQLMDQLREVRASMVVLARAI